MKNPAELRSRYFFSTGNALSILAISFLVGVFCLTFFYLNFWQHNLLGDMHSLKDACEYRVVSGENATPFEKIAIPHYGKNLLSGSNFNNPVLQYRCRIEPRGENMAIANFGWIIADKVTVTQNNTQKFSLGAGSKLTISVQGPTELLIDVVPRSVSAWSAGFASNHPAVITYTQAEANIMGGIEILLGLVKALNQILPIFALVGIVGIAWINGFKSRIFLMAIYTLIWIVLQRSVNVLSLLMQADLMVLNRVSTALTAGYVSGNVLFYMEVFRIKPKSIYPMARIHFMLVSLAALIPFIPGINLPLSLSAVKASTAPILLIFCIITFRNRKLDHPDLRRYFLVACTAVICFAVDGISGIGLARDFSEVFLPILMAVSLILDFTGSEKRYQEQRLRSEELKEQVTKAEATTTTLGRFLPEVLVTQLSGSSNVDIECTLAGILSPCESQVALIQADIRGFSAFLESNGSEEVSRVLRTIFEPVVNNAQKYGMVKLIGDCLFVFVEENKGENAVLKTLEIAESLVVSMQQLYSKNAKYKCLRFGIGINYGRVLLGNLSSSTCIDYTVLGKAVNLVSRLEECTKQDIVALAIGTNGVVFGPEAYEKLPDQIKAETSYLKGVKIRSFPDVPFVAGLTAEQICRLSLYKAVSDVSHSTEASENKLAIVNAA